MGNRPEHVLFRRQFHGSIVGHKFDSAWYTPACPISILCFTDSGLLGQKPRSLDQAVLCREDRRKNTHLRPCIFIIVGFLPSPQWSSSFRSGLRAAAMALGGACPLMQN